MIYRKKEQVYKNGFTLVEVLLSVTILTIGIIGSVGLIGYNASLITNSANRLMAANLAQDGFELVRGVRDTNWLRISNGVSGAKWDDNIEGTNPSNTTIKFFCGDANNNNKITPPPSGIDDAARCSGTGANRPCQIYVYTKTANPSLGAQCYSDNFGSAAGYSRVATGFYRLIKLEQVDIDGINYYIRVTVTVKWIERGQNQYMVLKGNLFNWKND